MIALGLANTKHVSQEHPQNMPAGRWMIWDKFIK